MRGSSLRVDVCMHGTSCSVARWADADGRKQLQLVVPGLNLSTELHWWQKYLAILRSDGGARGHTMATFLLAGAS